MRVTERFRHVNVGRMEIDITIDDPKAYTKPLVHAAARSCFPIPSCSNTSAPKTPSRLARIADLAARGGPNVSYRPLTFPCIFSSDVSQPRRGLYPGPKLAEAVTNHDWTMNRCER